MINNVPGSVKMLVSTVLHENSEASLCLSHGYLDIQGLKVGNKFAMFLRVQKEQTKFAMYFQKNGWHYPFRRHLKQALCHVQRMHVLLVHN